MPETPTAADWQKLREPFPEDQLELKPQPVSKNQPRDDRGRCEKGGRTRESKSSVSVDGTFCGGYHGPSVHLTYVGHAGITDRLNEVCGPENWSIEPLAYDEQGQPVIANYGCLWVKLTIWGVTKVEVGDSDGRGGYEQGKLLWSDSLKRAAMRFGIGTYLWSKSQSAKELTTGAEVEQDDRQELPPSKPAKRARGEQARAQRDEDPWARHPLTDDGKQQLRDLLVADDPDRVKDLWRAIRAAGQPQTVTLKDLGGQHAAALDVAGDVDLLALATRVGEHLTANGISVAEHVAAVAAPEPVGSGDAEAARDASDVVRGADEARMGELRKAARGQNGGQQT